MGVSKKCRCEKRYGCGSAPQERGTGRVGCSLSSCFCGRGGIHVALSVVLADLSGLRGRAGRGRFTELPLPRLPPSLVLSFFDSSLFSLAGPQSAPGGTDPRAHGSKLRGEKRG